MTHLHKCASSPERNTAPKCASSPLHAYTRRSVGFAMFSDFWCSCDFSCFCDFCAAGENFGRIPLNIAFLSLKMICAHPRPWEISPLGGTFPYSDLHTHLVHLKFRPPQNATLFWEKQSIKKHKNPSKSIESFKIHQNPTKSIKPIENPPHPKSKGR